MLTFIATSHNEPKYNRMFIDSMLNQTDSRWKAKIINNGQNPTLSESEYNYELQNLSNGKLSYEETLIDSGNWGTKNRQTGIDECDTEYIIQTSIQDIWLPQSVQYINETIEKHNHPDIVYWNSINHVVGPCLVLDGQLKWSKCDWGQFAIKTEIAKKIGIQRGELYCGDWAFIEDCLNSGLLKKQVKINGILTIHN